MRRGKWLCAARCERHQARRPTFAGRDGRSRSRLGLSRARATGNKRTRVINHHDDPSALPSTVHPDQPPILLNHLKSTQACCPPSHQAPRTSSAFPTRAPLKSRSRYTHSQSASRSAHTRKQQELTLGSLSRFRDQAALQQVYASAAVSEIVTASSSLLATSTS